MLAAIILPAIDIGQILYRAFFGGNKGRNRPMFFRNVLIIVVMITDTSKPFRQNRGAASEYDK